MIDLYTTIEYAEVGGFDLMVPDGYGGFQRAIDAVLHIDIEETEPLRNIEADIKIGEVR